MKTLSLDYLSVSQKEGANMPLAKILSVFASQNAHPDRFYLTGFEGLCVEAGHSAVCEAVISSAMPFDRELLVIGCEKSDTCSLWRSICHRLDVPVSFLDVADEDLLDALSTILQANRNISHVLCSSERSSEMLRKIGAVVRNERCSFVVDNCTDVISMKNINDFCIDFLITASTDNDENPISLIVARRSRLVQTEGNARTASQDIYTMWQKSMQDRRSTLEPMFS